MYSILIPQRVNDKIFTSVTKELIFNCLTVYEYSNMSRIGGNTEHNDGGYVICSDFNNYDILISAGIGGDITFEKDVTERYNIKCMAYDGECNSATDICSSEELITHIPKNISNINSEKTTNLKDSIQIYKNVFLKMDIEGGEYTFLENLTNNDFKNISQIVIEFHFVDIITKWKILEKITETHYLVHFHANNNNQVLYCYDGFYVPAVFECTYINKNLVNGELPLNKIELPNNMDKPNIKDRIDYNFNCKPWVNK